MNLSEPFMIFSAERAGLTKVENASRTDLVARLLHNMGIAFVKAEGWYNGVHEHSFVVFTYDGSNIADKVERIARTYQQESILYVDTHRLAYLLYLDTQRTVELGTWRELKFSEAAERNHTTIAGKYYVAA